MYIYIAIKHISKSVIDCIIYIIIITYIINNLIIADFDMITNHAI